MNAHEAEAAESGEGDADAELPEGPDAPEGGDDAPDGSDQGVREPELERYGPCDGDRVLEPPWSESSRVPPYGES